MMKTRSAIAVLIVGLAACSDEPKPVPPPGAAPAMPEAGSAAAAPAEASAAVPMPAHAGTTSSPTPAASLPPDHPPLTQASLPPGHPPMGQAGGFEVAPPAQNTGKGSAGLQWSEPKGWLSQKPSSAMRKAQYRVPGPGGDAECVVFYFGPGQGGDAMSNASRWASQFRAASGEAPMKTRELKSGDTKVLLVEVMGTYVGGMGSNVPGEQPGYMLLGAIAQGPDANWFFKLTGPEKTVQAQRAAFEAMVGSLKKGA